MYDLLIRKGEVVDPSQGLHDILDIAIEGSKIERLAKGIDASKAKEVINAQGKVVTPGLIDLHVHVYDGGPRICLRPDSIGVKVAVTTLVDAGSAGSATIEGFANSVVTNAITTTLCFLNIAATGLSNLEIRDWEEINVEATVATVQRYPELIKGIKLLLHGSFAWIKGLELFKIAKRAARESKTPIMIHIGDREAADSWDLTRHVLPLLEKGDIISHIFTALPGRVITRTGSVLPEFLAAKERGVILDVAHGSRNFCFEVAERALEQGIYPTVISSDLAAASINGPVYSLTETMSKFLTLGLSVNDVVAMTTVNPARALGMENKLGSLKVGMPADVSILELKDCKKQLVDAVGETRQSKRCIVPVETIKSGKVIRVESYAASQNC